MYVVEKAYFGAYSESTTVKRCGRTGVYRDGIDLVACVSHPSMLVACLLQRQKWARCRQIDVCMCFAQLQAIYQYFTHMTVSVNYRYRYASDIIMYVHVFQAYFRHD